MEMRAAEHCTNRTNIGRCTGPAEFLGALLRGHRELRTIVAVRKLDPFTCS
jgi:hypothetical protein